VAGVERGGEKKPSSFGVGGERQRGHMCL